MKTLKDYVIATKCRKGKAAAINSKGAYWFALRVKIRDYGGNGIGNDQSSVTNNLELRHYRSGDVSAVVYQTRWHQNSGSDSRAVNISKVLDAQTVEDVITALNGANVGGEHAYGSYCADDLTAALTGLGMPVSLPAPDEADEAIAA